MTQPHHRITHHVWVVSIISNNLNSFFPLQKNQQQKSKVDPISKCFILFACPHWRLIWWSYIHVYKWNVSDTPFRQGFYFIAFMSPMHTHTLIYKYIYMSFFFQHKLNFTFNLNWNGNMFILSNDICIKIRLIENLLYFL
jgi:hypothetical protein